MLNCNHVPYLTKPDNFVACRLCNEIWWDSLAYERSQQPSATVKPPTATTLAKAISEGAARQLKLNVPMKADKSANYYNS